MGGSRGSLVLRLVDQRIGPALRRQARGIQDGDELVYGGEACGYVIELPGGLRIYHAGDTAYFDGFREIGQRLSPEVALLPIGAYHPDSFRNVHTSPEDAAQAFLDLGARWMVPMHYGTFRLGYEPIDEPVPRLKAVARQRGIEKRICVLEEGVTTFFSSGSRAQAEQPAAEGAASL